MLGRLEELSALRIEVFRDFPYLYEGTLEDEADYLQTFAACPRAMIVLVSDGERSVGASTVLPLSEAPQEMQAPFVAAGMALDAYDYFGESVLLREYRGRGLGARFFEEREAHARRIGATLCTFCAVERPPTHLARPLDYVDNEAFWMRRGYTKSETLRATLSWRDVGQTAASGKTMTFWTKQL